MARYMQTFTVRGRMSFPIDMLRTNAGQRMKDRARRSPLYRWSHGKFRFADTP